MSKLRKAARGRQCKVRLPGICNWNPETTVLAHYRKGHYGIACKPDDRIGAWACSDCHAVLDGQASTDLTRDFLDHEFLRAVIETQRTLIDEGLM